MSIAETANREPPSKRKEELDGQDRKPKSHEMGLQVPRCVHTEMSKKDVVPGVAKAPWRGVSGTGAIPYDVPGVEMTHDGDLCSFDAFLKKYDLTDPALQQLAVIVRGADTSRLDLAPQSAGFYALSLGLSTTFSDDHEMLGHGMVMYDALYAWCKSCQAGTHNWPPSMAA